ncbi:MAG: hypothetical protein ACP5N1_02545 [Candidatus Woesearchaeota archaeon]
MFRKKRSMINGVELPEEFSGGSIINNVAISSDGQKYAAITKSKDIIIADIPSDGKIEVDGTVITYQKNSSNGFSILGGHIRMNSFSVDSLTITGGNSIMTMSGKNVEYEIDEAYDSVTKLTLKESANDINLGLAYDKKVHVRGITNSEPTYQNSILFVDGLEGKLLIPESNSEIELDIKTSAGNIKGQVAHKGRIKTSAGAITLELYAPISIETSTSAGDVSVKGMISEGRGIYTPPNAKSLGTLVLKTSAGDIKVSYMPR